MIDPDGIGQSDDDPILLATDCGDCHARIQLLLADVSTPVWCNTCQRTHVRQYFMGACPHCGRFQEQVFKV